MKVTLTPSQTVALHMAPVDWGPVPRDVSTDALKRHGLVLFRDAPGAGLLRGFQWRLTPTGCSLVHRLKSPSVDEKAMIG